MKKRSVIIAGHRTSVSLEEPFWLALREIAASRSQTVSEFVSLIDDARGTNNLSSAIRIAVFKYYRNGGGA